MHTLPFSIAVRSPRRSGMKTVTTGIRTNVIIGVIGGLVIIAGLKTGGIIAAETCARSALSPRRRRR